MIATFFLRFVRTVSLAAAVLLTPGFGSGVMAQSVAAMVNGEAITNFDIDQRIKLTQLTTRKAISRQEALDELINDKLKIKEGKKYGLDMSSSDIDGAYGNMASRMRLNPEQLNKTLEGHGIRPETLKGRIKADIRVDLPHPRHYTLKTSPEFSRLKAQLTEEIRVEAVAADQGH